MLDGEGVWWGHYEVVESQQQQQQLIARQVKLQGVEDKDIIILLVNS